MRELKFRVWDKEFKRMKVTGIGINVGVLTGDDVEIMQYTGLKDKNGKEIYDGDILRYHGYHNLGLVDSVSVSQVEWGETGDSDGWAHESHLEWVVGADSLADIYTKAEVIGNIYENPELLRETT